MLLRALTIFSFIIISVVGVNITSSLQVMSEELVENCSITICDADQSDSQSTTQLIEIENPPVDAIFPNSNLAFFTEELQRNSFGEYKQSPYFIYSTLEPPPIWA